MYKSSTLFNINKAVNTATYCWHGDCNYIGMKTKEQKVKELNQLAMYKEQLLKTKISVETPKKEIEEMKRTYKNLNKAIKLLSDELFGKVIVKG